MNYEVDALEFSFRVSRILKEKNINTINDLYKYSVNDLLSFSGFGRKSIIEIQTTLIVCGYPPIKQDNKADKEYRAVIFVKDNKDAPDDEVYKIIWK